MYRFRIKITYFYPRVIKGLGLYVDCYVDTKSGVIFSIVINSLKNDPKFTPLSN